MTEPTPLVRRYVAWVSRNAPRILSGSVVVAVVAAAALLRLEFDVGLVSMLPQGSSRFADYQRFVERFGAQDLAIVLVHGRDREATGRFADAFARELEARPEIADVRSRVDRGAFLNALGEGALVRLLPVDRYDEVRRRLSDEGLEGAVSGMKRALSMPGGVGMGPALAVDPFGLSIVLAEELASSRPDRALDPGSEALATADGLRRLLLVRPARGGYDLEDVDRLVAAMSAAEDATRARLGMAVGDAAVRSTGAFAYAREDATLLRRDITLYVFLAVVGVLAVFYLAYRDLRILPFVTYHLSLTTLVTLALGILLLGRLNLLSLAFAAIFYGLGIDAAIHFYTRFLEERAVGDGTQGALARALAALLPPTLLATATTAVAFGVVGFSSLNGVAQLGFLTAAGLLLNVPATFLVMAALLAWFDRRGGFAAARPPTRATWLAAVASGVAARRRVAGPVLLGMLAVAGFAAARASLDTDLFHLRPADSAARRVDREIQREFGFTDPHGSVLIETSRVDDARAVDGVLATAEIATKRLRAEQASGAVRSVTSLSPFLPSRRTQEARIAAWRALPRARAAATLDALLEREGFRREEFEKARQMLLATPEAVDATREPLPGLGVLIERQLERDEEALSVLVSFTPASDDALEAVAERLIRDVVPPPGVSLVVTGRPRMEAELRRTAHRELVGFLAVVLGCTGTLIALRERRFGPTLALLAVPVASVVSVLAVAATLGVPLTPVSVVVLPLTIGIGLDDCLYLVERYREAGDVGEAVACGGRALSITTATTIAGFGALALSRYPALSGLGALAAVSLAICLATTIVVLPALLSPAWLRPAGAGTAG